MDSIRDGLSSKCRHTGKRPGRRGRLQCRNCRSRKKGESCVIDGDNVLDACAPCRERGFSAKECGEKTWPPKSKRCPISSPLPDSICDISQLVNEHGSELTPAVSESVEIMVGTSEITDLPMHGQIRVTPPTAFQPDVSPQGPHVFDKFDLPSNTTQDHLMHSAYVRDDQSAIFGDITWSEAQDPSVPSTLEMSLTDPINTDEFIPALIQVDGFDYKVIFDRISASTSPRVGHSIVSYLRNYYQTSIGPIRGCRTSVLYSLTADYDLWPVIQWKEGDIEVIKIFDIRDEEDPSCNWLTHYGMGKHSTPMGKDWKQAAISWSVEDTRALMSLIVASQHLLGSLQLSCSHRYVQPPANGSLIHTSQGDPMESAKPLFTHVLGIKEITTTFDKIAPLFEELSEREGKSHLYSANLEVVQTNNGVAKTMLRGWLDL